MDIGEVQQVKDQLGSHGMVEERGRDECLCFCFLCCDTCRRASEAQQRELILEIAS